MQNTENRAMIFHEPRATLAHALTATPLARKRKTFAEGESLR
jgi:hypothetical protein